MKTIIIAAFVAAFVVVTCQPARAQFRPCVWPNTCAK